MRRARQGDEAGSGLLASTWSVLAFFMFLFLALQIGVNLYATSTVSALGYDAARRAASSGGTRVAVDAAEQWLRGRLGPSLRINDITWRTNGGVVRLDIDARPPSLMIDTDSTLGSRRIRRSFEVRTELLTASGVR